MTDARRGGVPDDCRRDAEKPGPLRAWWSGRKAKFYERSVRKGLDEAYSRCKWEEPFRLGKDRLVIFSDHHRGARDGADDFWVAERAYRSALAYYREAEFRLALLGDVEELWENHPPSKVMECYEDVLGLELEFPEKAGGLWRFYGNHDLQWKDSELVATHLGVGIKVHESLKLRMKRGNETEGTLFLTHGHQGTWFSHRIPEVALPVVRHVWAPWQRLSKRSLNTPSRDYNLRETHERAMAAWAKQPRSTGEQVVLVAGHTHRPVFGTSRQSRPDGPLALEAELDAARRDPSRKNEVPSLAVRVEHARASERYYSDPEEIDPPCLFNTGCCSFSDGDVTGIEVDEDEIRLVRWTKSPQDVKPQRLACLPISAVLTAVRKSAPLDEDKAKCLPTEPDQTPAETGRPKDLRP